MKRFILLNFYHLSFSPRLVSLSILGAAFSALSILYLFNPATSPLFPPCLFRALTGWQCPGCGTLRGLHQLLHGHLESAWELNPLMLLTLPLILWAGASHLSTVVRERPLPRPFIRPVWIWLFLAIIIVFSIMRNL